jgi:2-methylcitrate dehydratase
MTKVSARPNAAYTDAYPQRMPAKISVRLTDGTTFSRGVQDCPWDTIAPATWDDVQAASSSGTSSSMSSQNSCQ